MTKQFNFDIISGIKIKTTKLIKENKNMKTENMKNYTDYNDWLDSNYLSSDYTDEEINDLYEMCMKNDSFDDKDELPF